MEYMQEVQDYGQPPIDIIKEIAPGLDVNEDGMPNFEGMPWGLPGSGKNEECSIM
jgi:Pex19 protein family